MRVVFVDNLLFELKNGSREFDLQPHLGLISLISAIENVGHNGVLFDPKLEIAQGRIAFDSQLYQTAAESILQLEPDAVGFTSLGCNFICTSKTAGYIKLARPDLPILLGGPHATILDQPILRSFAQFDVIVRHEAEITLPQVLGALPTKQLHLVPGVTFRDRGHVISNPGPPLIEDLDSLPYPAFDRYPIGSAGLTSVRVEAGRGCPFACTFCSTASFFGRRYRLKSPKRLCDELDRLNADYGIRHFSLTHDLFTVNRHKVLAFCDEVRRRQYTWSCSARMDCVDSNLLHRMQDAGCRSIYYGIETGSPRMQKIVQKNQDLEIFESILDRTHSLGISCTVSFITGYPQEDFHDQEETLDLAGRCFSRNDQLTNIQLHLLTPEPGTALLDQFSNDLLYDGHISDFNFPTLEPDDSSIMAGNPEIFVNHHYFSSLLPRRRHVFVTECFALLQTLGSALIRATLELYDGSLSALIGDVESWSDFDARKLRGDSKPFEEFFCQRFGHDHIITSLVRYINAVNRLSGSGSVTCHDGRAEAFVLRKNMALLRQIHDAGEILNRLRLGDSIQKLAQTLGGEIHDVVIELSGSHEGIEGREIRTVALSKGTADIIEYFETPRSRKQFFRRFESRVTDVESAFNELKQTFICSSDTPGEVKTEFLM